MIEYNSRKFDFVELSADNEGFILMTPTRVLRFVANLMSFGKVSKKSVKVWSFAKLRGVGGSQGW